MITVRQTIGFVCGAGAVCLLVAVWGLHAGPLDPAAPPASTMKSMQELYDLTNSTKGAALPAPLVAFNSGLFLLVDGIPGESTDDKHKNWIDINAFHWGIWHPRQSSTAEQADLTLVKSIDRASPLLYQACSTGQSITSVRFNVCRTGQNPTPIYWFILSDVVVTSIKPVGSSVGPTPYLMEELTLSYGKIEVYYRPTTGPDIVFQWDLRTNK